MKVIKLSGRERSVLRAIDFANATPASDILATTRLEPSDMVDILNGLTDVGYVEPVPYVDSIGVEQIETHSYEVNPSYAQQLRNAMRKSWA